MENGYMIFNSNDEIFELVNSKEEAEIAALNAIKSMEEEVSIYKIERIGIAFIPDPTPIIDWKED